MIASYTQSVYFKWHNGQNYFHQNGLAIPVNLELYSYIATLRLDKFITL